MKTSRKTTIQISVEEKEALEKIINMLENLGYSDMKNLCHYLSDGAYDHYVMDSENLAAVIDEFDTEFIETILTNALIIIKESYNK